MQTYAFRQCSLTLLDKRFGLRQIFTSPILDQWLRNTLLTMSNRHVRRRAHRPTWNVPA